MSASNDPYADLDTASSPLTVSYTVERDNRKPADVAAARAQVCAFNAKVIAKAGGPVNAAHAALFDRMAIEQARLAWREERLA